MTTTPDAIPDGQAVERLAMLMACSVGAVWTKLSDDEVRGLRVMANAALMHNAVPGAEAAMLTLRAAVTDSISAQRAAADALEGEEAAEPIIRRLHRGATALTALLGAMGGLDDGKDDF